jgi:hypothetical protein
MSRKTSETWGTPRIEEIDSGKVQMIPYEEVRRRLAARLSDAAR